MVRIGFVRWLVNVSLEPIGHGQSRLSLKLKPQSSTYRTYQRVWRGIHDTLEEKDVSVGPLSVETTEPTHTLNGRNLARMSRMLAKELATSAVTHSSNIGIIDCNGYDKAAAIYIVEASLMNAVSAGRSDPEETQDEPINLIPDMMEVRAARAAQALEEARLAEEEMEAHRARVARARGMTSEATKTSLELLYNMLSKSEAEEARDTGKVTVRTPAGEFIVPVTAHGLVNLYVDKKYKMSYCVVFKDFSIPVGDEALMKVAMLKVDPARFMKVANKFHRPERYPGT